MLENGLMNRFKKQKLILLVLYIQIEIVVVVVGQSWNELQVKLDSWHYMRRIALGCTSESHTLYGVFMGKLSACIF